MLNKPNFFKYLFLVFSSIFLSSCIFVSVDLKPKELYEERFVSGNEKSANKILLLPIKGIILNESASGLRGRDVCTPEKIQEQLRRAVQDKHIKAIILEIDSPGGGVTASDIIYKDIKDFKEAHPDIPVIALMKDTAASGAYYISMASDYIVAHPSSITGSIGVISLFVILEDVLKWAKVEVVVIKSGKAKDIGSPFRKMTRNERKFIKKIINEMYERFLEVVYEGRKGVLTKDEVRALADGRILTGQTACAEKLVDKTGYLKDAVEKARESARLADVKVIRYKRVKGALEAAFRLENSLDNIALLRQIIRQNNTSKFMYLWLPAMEHR